MNSSYQPGQHPDADTLSALAEHALPPHEQQQTLAHLATCPDCRQLVYVIQQANPIELQNPQPGYASARRPFFNWRFVWPTAIACAVFVALYMHNLIPFLNHATANNPSIAYIEQHTSIQPQGPQPTVASVAPPLAAPPPRALEQAQSQPPTRDKARAKAPAEFSVGPTPKPAALAFSPQPAIAIEQDGVATLSPPSQPIAALGTLSLARNLTTPTALHGTITDPSGAAISRARVTATNTLTGASLSRETSATGDFLFTSLPSGTYTVEAAAPGFQSLTEKDIRVEAPTQLALNLKLPIGSANQTVTVTDAPPALDTASAALGGTIENELYTELPLKASTANPVAIQPPPPAAPPLTAGMQQGVYGGTGQANLNQNYVEAVPTANATLTSKSAAPAAAKPAAVAAVTGIAGQQLPTLPSHLPTLSTIASAHHSLAIDTAGTLFRSEDAGVTWLPVTTQWKGRATHLTLTPPLAVSALAQTKSAADVRSIPPPTFQLTTDTGTLYTSPDGQTWRLK